MLYRFKIYRNGLRRWIVKRLLGHRLIVQKKDTPSGPEWQLVDMKRRIPYGWFYAVAVNERDFRIVSSLAHKREDLSVNIAVSNEKDITNIAQAICDIRRGARGTFDS